jgi:hypothetical protein
MYMYNKGVELNWSPEVYYRIWIYNLNFALDDISIRATSTSGLLRMHLHFLSD